MNTALRLLGGALLATILAACGSPGAALTPISTPTRVPTATFAPTAIPTITPTPIVIYTLTPTIEPPPTRTPSLTPLPSATPTITLTPPPQSRLPSGACGGQVSADNKLVNGNFEGGQHQQGASDIQVPAGWTAFWKKEGSPTVYDPQNGDGYQRPEMHVINSQPPYDNPPRIFEGAQAFHVTGNQRAFDAGIWQQVQVTAGVTYCLTGEAHAWSSYRSDNPFQSTLDIADDQRNANFLFGIDPIGATDPWSEAIQWGNPAHLYDHYQPIYALQVAAQNSTITVYVRGYMMWRFNHNELFFDAISLNQMGP